MLFKVIACEIAFRELCMAAARATNLVELEFLTQGYHDNPDIGLKLIQEKIDAVPEGKYDAILLGYALCNNMLAGMAARHTQLVIPRAHDCITFFMGSKEQYQEYFNECPGTYFYTSGWLEHSQRKSERVPPKGYDAQGRESVSSNPPAGTGNPSESNQSTQTENQQSSTPQQSTGYYRHRSYQELVEQYGEDNAKYVMEFMGGWKQNYTHGLFINFDFASHLNHQERVKQICRQSGWEYREIEGDLSLLQRWLDGDWLEDDFLVVKPGQKVYASHDGFIIKAEY